MRLQATSQRARDKNRGILSSLGGRALCLRLKRRVHALLKKWREQRKTRRLKKKLPKPEKITCVTPMPIVR